MNFIFNIFNKWGLIAVLLLVTLEYACFPLPSEVVLPFAGYIANNGGYNLWAIICVSVLCGYIGSLVCYVIGYYGGNYLFDKIYNRFPKWRKGLDNSNDKFDKYGNLSVLFCRIIPLCRTYISFLAGLYKQKIIAYSFFSILGIFIWNMLLISLGFVLKDNWSLVIKIYSRYKMIVIILFLLLLIFLMCKLYKRKNKTKNNNGD